MNSIWRNICLGKFSRDYANFCVSHEPISLSLIQIGKMKMEPKLRQGPCITMYSETLKKSVANFERQNLPMQDGNTHKCLVYDAIIS